MASPSAPVIDRLEAGIPGLELVTNGGLPRRRLTLVAGTAGSGKTVFAAQFLASGIRERGEGGVFVTFEERPEGIRRNMRSLGWDIESWEREGRWAFVDASPQHQIETVFTGSDYALGPLLTRIAAAIEQVGASRVALDSVGSLMSQFERGNPARQALFQLGCSLEQAGVTTVVTAERAEDYGPITRLGFEEFVADNVIILRNALDGEKRRRTIEILKMRGGAHLRGEHLFTLLDGEGIVVVPVAISAMGHSSSTRRLSSGVPELDQMLGGGLYEKSLWLVAGSTGTGKSLLAAQFVAEAPEAASLENHLQRMKATIEQFRPDRVVIDSLTALQRVATIRSFREYVLGLTIHIKHRSMLGMVTSTGGDLVTSGSGNDLHASTTSDVITLLHYVPTGGEVHRAIQVLKMRGSDHDKALREYRITGRGMEIGAPIHDASHLF